MCKIFNRVSLLLCLLWATACVSKTGMYDDDKPTGTEEPEGTSKVSVQYLKSLYRGYPLRITEDLELHVVVAANDLFGAFPYTLVVQDETGGIEIKISVRGLYTEFAVGQQLLLRCQELTLGGYGGLVQLGTASADLDYETGFIAEVVLPSYLNKTGRPIVEVLPETVTIEGLLPRHVDKLVALEQVQFTGDELSLSWCDDEYAGTRHIVDPAGNILEVWTHPDASFAGNVLPSGSGYIEGILSYFNKSYQLRVFSPKNVLMRGKRF